MKNDFTRPPKLSKEEELKDMLAWAKAYVNDTLFYRHDYTGRDLNDAQRKSLRAYARYINKMANAGKEK